MGAGRDAWVGVLAALAALGLFAAAVWWAVTAGLIVMGQTSQLLLLAAGAE